MDGEAIPRTKAMVAGTAAITTVWQMSLYVYVLPSLMKLVPQSGHGVIQNFGADTMGNNVHAADSFGSVIGQ